MTQAQTVQKTDADVRKDRGALLAQRIRITRKAPGLYIVPASASPGSYVVEVGDGRETCTCPDFELRAMRCKHACAVEFSRRTETMSDGAAKVVTETLKVTYSQEWTSYNTAQSREKEYVLELLRSLCDGVPDVEQIGRGQRRLPMSDRVFAIVMKVYGGMSSRRTDTDMRGYASQGYLSKSPSYNAVIHYMDDPEMTPILRQLLQESAAPLATVERDFAVDSTGFSTCTYRRWFDEKYGKQHSEALWVKAHAIVGVRTNVITDAVITNEADGADSPQLPALVAGTKERFTLKEVSADKAYLAIQNVHVIADAGAAPYIPFKSNSTGGGKHAAGRRSTALWRKLFGYFTYQREDFLSHYNKRSNVEATFSSLKRKFGPSLKSKTFTAQVNETYAKMICFNLSMLVHEMFELGVVATFWQGQGRPVRSVAVDLPTIDLPMIELDELIPAGAAQQMAGVINERGSDGSR